jgi:arginase
MGVLCKALADEVAAVRAVGNLPVVLAGDCTFSIGVAAGLQRETPDFTLVWFDAHGDFNTHETTPSGFIGGMPLAMLCGRGKQTIVDGAGATVLPEADIILTDARDLDPGEAEAVADANIIHLADVGQLAAVDLPDKPIYIHFDVDVLRLSDLSAVSYPAQGGPSLESVATVLGQLAATGQVAAVSVTIWNPDLDDDDNSAENIVMTLVETFVDQL